MARGLASGKLSAGKRRKGATTELVYNSLRSGILSLEFAPGTVLDEPELAQSLGVSRTPVREALIRLSAEGFIATISNRGARVAPLDFRTIREQQEALALSQRAIARWAAIRHEPEQRKPILEHMREFDKAVKNGDGNAMIKSNREFHVAIAACCGNDSVAEFHNRLITEIMRVSKIAFTYDEVEGRSVAEHLKRTSQEHHKLFELIGARDADAAEAIAGAHARSGNRRVADFLASTDASEITIDTYDLSESG